MQFELLVSQALSGILPANIPKKWCDICRRRVMNEMDTRFITT